jgi:hypothetical protein
MDIALPALIIFIIVLPGIAFIWAFNDKRFKFKAKRDFINTISSALIPSLFIHIVGIYVANCWSYTHVKTEAIGYLLLGTEDDSHKKMIFNAIFESKGRIMVYFIITCVATYLLGKLLFILIKEKRLDLKFPTIFKFDEWFYYLSGQVLSLRGIPVKESVDAVIADVLTVAGSSTTLYSGFIERYTLNNQGIETLGLIHVGRWEKKKLILLPGDYLVLQGKDIINLHFRYVKVDVKGNPEKGKKKKGTEPHGEK